MKISAGGAAHVVARSARRVSGPFRGCLMGTAAVAFLLAFGRWGSYVGVPAIRLYATEILLAGVIVAWLRRRPDVRTTRKTLLLVAPVLAIPVVAVGRLLGGPWPNADAVRDIAPYMYALVVLFPFARADADAASRSLRVLRAAMIVHVVGVAIRILFMGFVDDLPDIAPAGPEPEILGLRADFDSAVLAVVVFSCAFVLTKAGLSGRRRVLEALLLLGSVALVFAIGSRAGLLALIVCVVLVFVVRVSPMIRRTHWSPLRIAAVVIALATAAGTATQLGVIQRLRDTPAAIGIGVDTTKKQADATGTAKARLTVWRKTIEHVNSSRRDLFGVGFGPDFLHEAGSDDVLEGQTYSGVRAPHNYLINTYARMGWLGLVVVSLGLLHVLVATVLLVRRRPDEFNLTLAALLAALLAVALLGVIFEAPFGAVPGFWAAGCVLARLQSRSVDRPHGALAEPTLSAGSDAPMPSPQRGAVLPRGAAGDGACG